MKPFQQKRTQQNDDGELKELQLKLKQEAWRKELQEAPSLFSDMLHV